MLLTKSSLLRIRDAKEATHVKNTLKILVQKKRIVPACENSSEFQKSEHILKWSGCLTLYCIPFAVASESFTRFFKKYYYFYFYIVDISILSSILNQNLLYS